MHYLLVGVFIMIAAGVGYGLLLFVMHWHFSKRRRLRGSAHTIPRDNLSPTLIMQAGDASDVVAARTDALWTEEGRA